jgi:hypothetical protein
VVPSPLAGLTITFRNPPDASSFVHGWEIKTSGSADISTPGLRPRRVFPSTIPLEENSSNLIQLRAFSFCLGNALRGMKPVRFSDGWFRSWTSQYLYLLDSSEKRNG